ncbi:hypothetical protein ACVWXL_002897 [Bradyrhizobium sp. GM22.5]
MRRTCSLSSAVTPALSTALSATIFLAASLRASAGPDIALSMASRSAVNFELMASMLPPVVLPSSNGPGRSLRSAFILSRAASVCLRSLSCSASSAGSTAGGP